MTLQSGSWKFSLRQFSLFLWFLLHINNRNQHVTDHRVRGGHPLTLARSWMRSHLCSSSFFWMSYTLELFGFSSIYLGFMSLCLIVPPPYLTLKPSPSSSVPGPVAVFLWPYPPLASQSSSCRDCLHLQHTRGIKEGWNSLIRGWSEKKTGPAPFSTLSMVPCDP